MNNRSTDSESMAVSAAEQYVSILERLNVQVYTPEGKLRGEEDVYKDIVVSLFAREIIKPLKQLRPCSIKFLQKREEDACRGLVYRRDVLDMIAENNCEALMTLECYDRLIDGVFGLADEMSPTETFRQYKRMCDTGLKSNCTECPIAEYCLGPEPLPPEELAAVVKKWVSEHPEKVEADDQ